MMKKSLILLLGVVLCTGGCTAYVAGPPVRRGPVVYAGPAGIVVEDRPYYVRGPGYYSGGAQYVWVGGHWARRHGHRAWIHGRYVVR